MEQRMRDAATALAERLVERASDKVVFAESCTAGLISAAMAGVPGISQFLCGSFVTYREAAKQEMLNVPPELIRKHTAVSREVTEVMATNSLKRTEEATWSTAITGHLGPGVEDELDGKVFIAIAKRENGNVDLQSCEMFRLTAASRLERQQEAAAIAIEQLKQTLS